MTISCVYMVQVEFPPQCNAHIYLYFPLSIPSISLCRILCSSLTKVLRDLTFRVLPQSSKPRNDRSRSRLEMLQVILQIWIANICLLFYMCARLDSEVAPAGGLLQIRSIPIFRPRPDGRGP